MHPIATRPVATRPSPTRAAATAPAAPAERPTAAPRPKAPVKAQAAQGLPRYLLICAATMAGIAVCGFAGAAGLGALLAALESTVAGSALAGVMGNLIGLGAGALGGGFLGAWGGRKLADAL